MPLTKDGRKALASFINQYGADKGEDFFYAYMKKNPNKVKKWHGKKK